MDQRQMPWRVLEDPQQPTAPAHPPGMDAPKPAVPQATLIVGGLAAILAVGAIVIAFGAGSGGGVAVEGAVPLGSGIDDARPAADVGSGRPSEVVVVEVVGAIGHPGVYRLAPDARIGDLIDAAGGYGPRVDTDRTARELNLAALLHDGDQVRVPSRDDPAGPAVAASGTSSGGGAAVGALIDLNQATDAELDTLPGIGPVTAAKILTSRDEQPFVTVDDLQTRKLVGQKTFDGLKDLVTVR